MKEKKAEKASSNDDFSMKLCAGARAKRCKIIDENFYIRRKAPQPVSDENSSTFATCCYRSYSGKLFYEQLFMLMTLKFWVGIL